MRNVIIFILLGTLLLSCKKENRSQDNTGMIFIPKNEIVTIDQLAFDDDRFIDSCVFVPLETSDAGLINEITQIEAYNDRYYIFDQKMSKIKVFSSNGKFLFDIGREGDGPGEYHSINSFFIDEQEKKIGVFDPLKLAVHEYSLDGGYLQTIKHNQRALERVRKALCLDNYIYCYFWVTYNIETAYIMLSKKDYSIIDKWSIYPVQVDVQMSDQLMGKPFDISSGNLHYLSLYSDTIYTYKEGVKSPYMLIETGKPNIPADYFEGKPFEHKPSDAYFAVQKDKKYSPGFTELYETDRYILVQFRFNRDFYIVDKDEMKTYHILEPENLYFDFMDSATNTDNKLISIFNQQNITNYQSQFENAGTDYPEYIRELMQNYDPEDDNPILIVYYLKKSAK